MGRELPQKAYWLTWVALGAVGAVTVLKQRERAPSAKQYLLYAYLGGRVAMLGGYALLPSDQRAAVRDYGRKKLGAGRSKLRALIEGPLTA